MELATINLEVSRQSDLLRKLATEKMKQFGPEDVRDPESKKWYPDAFYQRQGDTSYNVQIANLGDATAEREIIKIDADGGKKEVKIVASVWMNSKTDKSNGNNTRYGLGEDGNWYKQTATSYRYDEVTRTNLWSLSSPTKVGNFESTKDVFRVLSELNPPPAKIA